MASLQLPIVLTKLSYLIDNPWTVSMARANGAGLILADSLIDRNLGVRPITLVGFSLGSRLIFACLRELAKKGAFGLIQNVYLFGSPIVANRDEYLRARAMVSGRFVNGYASNDWILGYLFRATSGGIMRVAGLAPVEDIPGLENIDVTKLVNGHMAYRAAMPRLLREVGWEIESDEFTEIEDPDPDNHEKRQRELIRELDEARKEAEAKPERRRFGLFKKGKLAKKKGWETYDDSMRDGESGHQGPDDPNGNVLFDIEAIRRELASEQIEVKQLESTLPPMKLEINGAQSSAEWNAQNLQRPLTDSHIHDRPLALRSVTEDNVAVKSAPPPTIAPHNGEQTDNPFDQGYDNYSASSLPTTAADLGTRPNGIYAHDSSDHNIPSTTSLPSPQWPSPLSNPHVHSNASLPHDDPPPQSPPVTSSTTLPNGFAGAAEHNAWLDEDDEDFGREQEVKMTFG